MIEQEEIPMAVLHQQKERQIAPITYDGNNIKDRPRMAI